MQTTEPAVAEYRPAAHAVQAETPGADENVPTGHETQFVDALSLDECVEAGHDSHVVSPVVLAYRPGEQGVHLDTPDADEEVPAEHGVQFAYPVLSEEYVPAGHDLHAFSPLALANVPGEQGVHDDAPGVDEYVPTGQSMHVLLEDPAPII